MIFQRYVKREIEIKDIKAISISTKSEEFVVHVNNSYDYRFACTNFRNIIVETIVAQYIQNTKQKKFKIFYIDKLNLNNEVTIKSDFKKKISKMPT